MSHFAELDGNNIVLRVIVAEQDFIDKQPGRFVQTSYNTRGGVHTQGGTPLRKNYAGVGYSYSPTLDAFMPPKPYPSWWLDEKTCLWNPPVPRPLVGRWQWNESLVSWEPM